MAGKIADFAVEVRAGDVDEASEIDDEVETRTEEPAQEELLPSTSEEEEEIKAEDILSQRESQKTISTIITEKGTEPLFQDEQSIDRNAVTDPTRFPSDYFLNKHTGSFKCLEQCQFSQSDLKVTLNFFPPLVDPGLDAALNYVAPEESVDRTGVEKYKKMCKDLEIVPISRIIKTLPTDILDLKYYGLSLKQVRGIADALKVNTHVRVLILEDNWMSPDAASLISDILRENMAMRILNLRECRLGEEGAEKLMEGIAMTQFLEELDLSFNSLGDRGLKYIQPSLIENSSIKKLNLSHNNLTEASGETLEQILIENKSLTDLDLSWNGFFTGPGNKKLCNGLKNNELLKRLNLSWNGIGTGPSMLPISKYIKKNEVLEFLDLSWNRIAQRSLRLIRGAITKNISLVHVKLGYNTYDPEEALSLGSVLVNAKNNLKILDMENMTVTKDFLPIAQRIRRMGKTIIYGKVLSNYQIHGPNINKLLFERCKYLAMKPKKKKMQRDFGHFILSLPDKRVSRDQFETLLKKKKVKKIDKDLLNELLSRFPAKRRKIDCEAMKSSFMEIYPDASLPPPPPPKKKKKKGKKKKKKTGESQINVQADVEKEIIN